MRRVQHNVDILSVLRTVFQQFRKCLERVCHSLCGRWSNDGSTATTIDCSYLCFICQHPAQLLEIGPSIKAATLRSSCERIEANSKGRYTIAHQRIDVLWDTTLRTPLSQPRLADQSLIENLEGRRSRN